MSDLDVTQLSNEELQSNLRERGFNVPVTPTSRRVCEKKLLSLVNGSSFPPEDTSKTINFDHPVETTPQPTARANAADIAINQPVANGDAPHASDSDMCPENEGEASCRLLSAEERAQLSSSFRSPRRQVHKNEDSTLTTFIIIVIILLICSFIIFLTRNVQHIDEL